MMKPSLGLATMALLVLTAFAWAADVRCKDGTHCISPPPPPCPDCNSPCDWRLHLPCLNPAKASQLMDQLCNGDCCARIKAADKLGSRLHADFCSDPAVLDALTRALQCDPCWEVRRAAAWSILRQQARTERGVLSLYLASKLDPHFMVRTRATEALDILLVCRKDCFKELFKVADELVKKLRGKYKPGSPDCHLVFEGCFSGW